MKPQTESKNITAVRRLYEARGNLDIVKTVLAPDVRWEVVEGFPHSGIYHGLNGVVDFFTRLFGDFEDWHTEPSGVSPTVLAVQAASFEFCTQFLYFKP